MSIMFGLLNVILWPVGLLGLSFVVCAAIGKLAERSSHGAFGAIGMLWGLVIAPMMFALGVIVGVARCMYIVL